MPRIKVPISNFQFGEVSPSLISRTDTKVYPNSAKKVENLTLMNEGGLAKRFGSEKIYEYDVTVESQSFTITISDYNNIVTGSQIRFFIDNETLITIEKEATIINDPDPSAPIGNRHFFRPYASNNTTAENLKDTIDAISGLTATRSNAVVTVTRDAPDVLTNITVTTTDSTRMAVTNFTELSPHQVRLIPFIFSNDERYIFSLENEKIKIFIIDPSTGVVSLAQTMTTVYNSLLAKFTTSNINEITYAQTGDNIIFAHSSFFPIIIKRTSLTAFIISYFEFSESANGFKSNQPFYSFQDDDLTLTASAVTGSSVTITASADYFITPAQAPTANHQNQRFRIRGAEIRLTTITNATTATANIFDKLEAHLDTDAIETTDGLADIEITFALHGLSVGDSIDISHAGAVGGISSSQINGTRTVQEVINENVFVVTAGATANASAIGGGSPKIACIAATNEWEQQAFSSTQGYPAAVTFHEGRLWFAGTPSQPDTLWASKSNDFFNFDVGDAEDNDSISLSAGTGEINSIRHLASNRDLQIFTSTSESYIPSFSEKPVTPTNARVRRQTPFGISHVEPKSIDGATVFVQANGGSVREFIFSDREDAYVATSVSALSSHLIKNPTQLEVFFGTDGRPESYAYVINKDGSIAVFTSSRAEQRAGWSEFTTGNGSFHSICAIDERLFVVGRYDKGGGTKKYILSEFKKDFDLDFAKKYSGVAGVFNVSADFANGAEVDVIHRNEYFGKFTVAGGNVDVSAIEQITSAEIGYSFNVEAETLPIDAATAGGPLTGDPRSINRVVIDLYETLSVNVNGKSVIVRQVSDDMSEDRFPVTGKREVRLLGYKKDPTILITQTSPLPIQINGLIAEVTF